jgi:hypothetical protein
VSDVKVCPQCGNEVSDGSRFCPLDGAPLRPKGGSGAKDLVGTLIAERFLVLDTLGEGGMGRVYLAEHVRMGRRCALKVMSPRMAADPDAISRFNREAANAARISHPNVCAVYDFGETSDGLVYLAMELVEGVPLTTLVEQEGALPPARAGSIAMQTAEALAAAHELGIVHRDLKPDNIMVARGRDGSDLVKVVDFGIAKMADNDAQKVTKTGLVVGTPEYMSPEQLAGDRMDGRSDIYSLALVTFNMLTGALPFPADSQQEAMIMRLTDRPKRLSEMAPSIAWTPELQAVLDRALARDAEERYASALDFGRELRAAIDLLPGSARPSAGTQILSGEPVSAPAGVPRTSVGVGSAAATGRAADATTALPATVSAPAGTSSGGSGGRAFPRWAVVVVGVVAVAGVSAAVMLNGGGRGADSTGVTPQGDATSQVSEEKPVELRRPVELIESVFARVDRLTTPTLVDSTDVRNGNAAVAALDSLMPRLTTRSDSAYAILLRGQAHLVMLQTDEGCRILRGLVPTELSTTHQQTLEHLLTSCSQR